MLCPTASAQGKRVSFEANLLGHRRARGLGFVNLAGVNPTIRTASSLTAWLTDLQSVALIACVAGVLSLPVPIWNGMQTVTAVTATKNDFWKSAGILILVLLILYSAVIPIFYFALYRNEYPLYFSKPLRLLALIAAFTFAVILLTTLPAWIRSLAAYLAVFAAFDWSIGATSVLAFVRDSRTIGQLFTLLGELSNIAYILVLIAMFRRADEPLEADAPVSRLLRTMTKIAVISWGLWVAFLVVRVIAMPFAFVQTRTYALQIGRTPPLLWEMMAEAIRTLLIQACLFAAPYIVYRSLKGRAEMPIEAQSGPELAESGG